MVGVNGGMRRSLQNRLYLTGLGGAGGGGGGCGWTHGHMTIHGGGGDHRDPQGPEQMTIWRGVYKTIVSICTFYPLTWVTIFGRGCVVYLTHSICVHRRQISSAYYPFLHLPSECTGGKIRWLVKMCVNVNVSVSVANRYEVTS